MAPVQRSARRRMSASPATPPPRFALVMHESAIIKHIQMIPLKSSMILGEELSEVATLTAPNGKAWQVRLNKSREKIWLSGGLKEFIKYYHIHYGSIVHFTYQGSSSFRVCIFDAMGSEIDYPRDDSISEDKHYEDEIYNDISDDEIVEILDTETPIPCSFVKREEDKSDGESFEVLDTRPSIFCGSSKRKASNVGHVEQQRSRMKGQSCFPPRRRGRPPKHSRDGASMAHKARTTKTSCEKAEKAYHRKEKKKNGSCGFRAEHEEYAEMVEPLSLSFSKSRKLNISKETEKAVHDARMCKLKHPSFMAILTPVNVIQKFVTVPVDFVKRHLGSPLEEYIQLEVENGKQKWSVRYYSDRKGLSSSFKRIGKGWDLFSSDNNLKEGDVCVFELINKEENNVLLRVRIYRAAEYADAMLVGKRLKSE